MNKIYLIFILTILTPFVSSISTTMSSNYQPAETMIIEIQGNILEPIERSDIVFKRQHVAVAVDYDVKRILNKYYLYAQLPTSPNNYTLFINNIATTINGQQQTVNYNQSFNVDGNISDYSINPGFIITNQDFYLNVNSNLDLSSTIDLDFPQSGSATLQPGTNTLQFKISSLQPGFYLAKIGKYAVPIQITNSIQQNQTQKAQLSVFPKLIRETLELNKPKSYNITLTNIGNYSINELYLFYNQEVFYLDKEILSIKPNSSENIIVNLKKLNSSIYETVSIVADNEIIANLTFDILFTTNKSEVTNSSSGKYYCSELGGKFCTATEICSVQTVQSLDGVCCIGVCLVEEQSSTNWIYYAFIGIVLIIVLIIYMRYRKTSLPKPRSISISSVLKRPI